MVLPASEGGQADLGQLLERGQRLVLLQTEAEVAAAEAKREEGMCVFLCVGGWVGIYNIHIYYMCVGVGLYIYI